MQNTRISKLLALILSAVLLFSLTACQNTDDGKKETVTTTEQAPVTTPARDSVTVKIICDDTVTKDVWENPVILDETEYAFDGEADAFTALTEVAQQHNITLVHSEGYVTGIGGLSAGDAGKNSGWMFQVNGELASVGAPDYTLQNGDALVWFYTADYNTYFN